ncbi:MAG: sodium-dependent transporter, partial [Pseudomonadota bacterium]
MAAVREGNDETWSGRVAFILAAIGSAVGIGNLVRFPYEAGENGGGAFVIVYLLAVFLIGLPVLMAELFLGRRGGGSSVTAIQRLGRAEGSSPLWAAMPWIAMTASFLIVTFYSVVSGWLLSYVVVMVGEVVSSVAERGVGALAGPAFLGESPEDITATFTSLLSSPGRMILFHAIFVGCCTIIVSRGIKGGIEKASILLMPIFFLLLIGLSIISLVIGDSGAAFEFLFAPDFEKLGQQFLNGGLLVDAVGQAFFSLGLGSALMMTYGIYLSRSTNIPSAAVTVAGCDTLVALVAGLAVFPIVFQFGLEPAGGLGLIFGPLLLAFSQMPFGGLFGVAFFCMGVFAALTSAISLFEVPTAVAKGEHDL